MQKNNSIPYELNNKVGIDWLIASLKEEMYGSGHNLFLPILDGGLMLFLDLYKYYLSDCNHSILDYHTINVDAYDEKIVKDKVQISKGLKGHWANYYKVFIIDDIYDSGSTLDCVSEHLITEHGFKKDNIVFVSMFRRNKSYQIGNFGISRANKNKIKSYSAISLQADGWYYGYGMDLNQKNRFDKQVRVEECQKKPMIKS